MKNKSGVFIPNFILGYLMSLKNFDVNTVTEKFLGFAIAVFNAATQIMLPTEGVKPRILADKVGQYKIALANMVQMGVDIKDYAYDSVMNLWAKESSTFDMWAKSLAKVFEKSNTKKDASIAFGNDLAIIIRYCKVDLSISSDTSCSIFDKSRVAEVLDRIQELLADIPGIPQFDGSVEWGIKALSFLHGKYIPVTQKRDQFQILETSISNVCFGIGTKSFQIFPVLFVDNAGSVEDYKAGNASGMIVSTSDSGIATKMTKLFGQWKLRNGNEILPVVTMDTEEKSFMPNVGMFKAFFGKPKGGKSQIQEFLESVNLDSNTLNRFRQCENEKFRDVTDILCGILFTISHNLGIVNNIQDSLKQKILDLFHREWTNEEKEGIVGEVESVYSDFATLLLDMIATNGIKVNCNGAWHTIRYIGNSASASRKAQSSFIQCESLEDFQNIIFALLNGKGKNDVMDFMKDIGLVNKESKANIKKLVARLFQESSNGLDIGKIAAKRGMTDILEEIKALASMVRFPEDPEQKGNKPHLRHLTPGNFKYSTEVRKYKVNDGGGMITFLLAAYLVTICGIFSLSDLTRFKELWSKCGQNLNVLEKARKNTSKSSKSYTTTTGEEITKEEIKELDALLMRIPACIQVRLGGVKGKFDVVNLEAIEGLNAHMIIPTSMQKFVTDLAIEHFQVLAWSHHGNGWTNMYSQALQVLSFRDNKAMLPIVAFHANLMKTALVDPMAALVFLKSFGNNEDECEDEDSTNPEVQQAFAANIAASAISANPHALTDPQVQDTVRKCIMTRVAAMKAGNIQIYGADNAFEVCDPYQTLKMMRLKDENGKELVIPFKTLEDVVSDDGKFHLYFNGEGGEMGMVRAPIISGFEFTKVQGITNAPFQYRYLQDVAVFVVSECAWDRLGGSDFDGDKIKLIRHSRISDIATGEIIDCGKILIDAIEEGTLEIYVPGEDAIKQTLDFASMAGVREYTITAMPRTKNRVGMFTNASSHCREIAWTFNHLAKFCIDNGLDGITFVEEMPWQDVINAMAPVNGKFPAIARMRESRITGDKFIPDGADTVLYAGFHMVSEMVQASKRYYHLADQWRSVIGLEIDSDKTGVKGEGKAYCDAIANAQTKEEIEAAQGLSLITEAMNIKLFSDWENTRTLWKGRTGKESPYLGFSALSVMSIAASKVEAEMLMDKTNISKVGMCHLLDTLLTDEERNALYASYEGIALAVTNKKAVSILSQRKAEFGNKIHVIDTNANNMNSSAVTASKVSAMARYKAEEAEWLINFANTHNIPLEVMAVAAYRAAYFTEDPGYYVYGWILFPWLLKVLRREGNRICVENFGTSANICQIDVEVSNDTMKIVATGFNGKTKTFYRKANTIVDGKYTGKRIGERWVAKLNVKPNTNLTTASAPVENTIENIEMHTTGAKHNLGKLLGIADDCKVTAEARYKLKQMIMDILKVNGRNVEDFNEMITQIVKIGNYNAFLTEGVRAMILANNSTFSVACHLNEVNQSYYYFIQVDGKDIATVSNANVAMANLAGKTVLMKDLVASVGKSGKPNASFSIQAKTV